MKKYATDKVLAQALRECGYRDRRRRNIVISGLRETGSREEDFTLFTNFCTKCFISSRNVRSVKLVVLKGRVELHVETSQADA